MAEIDARYGLPKEVKFCKVCNITNQRPNSVNEYEHAHGSNKKTIYFNEEAFARRVLIKNVSIKR